MKKIKQLFAGLCLTVLCLGNAQAYVFDVTYGHTDLSHKIHDLHWWILWVCVFIGIGVFGTMFYSIYHHRKSKGHEAAQFHENTTIEIIWTIIPFLILIWMAAPATKLMIELDDVKTSDMTIKVVGKQWYWEYDYLDSGIHIESHLDEASQKVHRLKSADPTSVPHYLLNVDHPLVVPVKKKIRFVFSSADVIHSWWVPDLGWKKDANPGFINEAWTSVEKAGTYRGQCTELCGVDHGFMPIVVIAMEQADYDAWVKNTLAKSKETPDLRDLSHEQLMAGGESVYLTHCISCHQIDGTGLATQFPVLKGSAKVNGDWIALDGFLRAGAGRMPSFSKLNGKQLAQVMTYVRNSFGNKAGGKSEGQEIQPKDAYIAPDDDE